MGCGASTDTESGKQQQQQQEHEGESKQRNTASPRESSDVNSTDTNRGTGSVPTTGGIFSPATPPDIRRNFPLSPNTNAINNMSPTTDQLQEQPQQRRFMIETDPPPRSPQNNSNTFSNNTNNDIVSSPSPSGHMSRSQQRLQHQQQLRSDSNRHRNSGAEQSFVQQTARQAHQHRTSPASCLVAQERLLAVGPSAIEPDDTDATDEYRLRSTPPVVPSSSANSNSIANDNLLPLRGAPAAPAADDDEEGPAGELLCMIHGGEADVGAGSPYGVGSGGGAAYGFERPPASGFQHYARPVNPLLRRRVSASQRRVVQSRGTGNNNNMSSGSNNLQQQQQHRSSRSDSSSNSNNSNSNRLSEQALSIHSALVDVQYNPALVYTSRAYDTPQHASSAGTSQNTTSSTTSSSSSRIHVWLSEQSESLTTASDGYISD